MPNSWKTLRISARQLAPAVLVVGLLCVASCSEVLENVGGYFEDDVTNERTILQAEGDQEFPKLSDVPNAPRPASTSEDIDQLSEGLIADRDEARYTNETLRSRYAEDAPILSERVVAESALEPPPESKPQQRAIQRKELRSAAAAEQVTKRRVARSSSSLAEERRIGIIEPASEAVLRDQRIGSAEERRIVDMGEGKPYGEDDSLVGSRRIASDRTLGLVETSETGVLREPRVAAARHASSRSGVMTISRFRAMFNERFDSSGRSTYNVTDRQQVAAQNSDNALVRERAEESDTADLSQAQIDSPRPTLLARTMQESRDNGQAAVSFQAASIPFAVGSASLNSLDRATLKEVVKLHRKFGGTVHVVGHSSQRTRDMGSESHRMVNFSLSLDRATAVSMELARLGVSAEAVTVIARSDNEPIAYEYMPEGEAYNRRADVYLEY